MSEDGLELIGKIYDEEGTAIYVDPPYLMGTRSGKSSAKYQHEFAAGDHEKLAAALARFRLARVAVSYYADPQLAELYPGWDVIELSAEKKLAKQDKRGQRTGTAPEVVLVNGAAKQGDMWS